MKFKDYYKKQVEVIKERDPSIHSDKEALTYPFFWAMWAYHKAHKLYQKGEFYKARKISQKATRKTGIEIHPGAVIGEGFFIDHGHGVVIGETTIIGDNVTLYQGVTLGGTGKEHGKRHPTLEDNVMVSAGAKVLGSITVGKNSKIGAGSVVIRDVPPNSTVVGIPGRVAKQDDVHVPRLDLNQVDLPDPIVNMIELLKDENETLKQTLKILEDKRALDHEQIQKNSQAVSVLEDKLLFIDGAGI